ncbi:alanine racemase [Virgibacillus phasianinus]|nr:alanine racemase [Virgibacillus phasianinus]
MTRQSIEELDTPSLIIDFDQMEENLKAMQKFADSKGIALRPHTKTHKSADIAHLQLEYGAKGITVAKVSEAEAMVNAGITDIFIATEIVGKQKLERIRTIAAKATLRVAVDSIYHVERFAEFFDDRVPIELMIEVDTGHGRCGVKPDDAIILANKIIQSFPGIKIRGVFTHEGHIYHAADKEQMKQAAIQAQENVIEIGKKIKEKWGIDCEVSVGCSLAQLTGIILPGITEIRPGTYVFYDVGHGYFLTDLKHCAATVLATITSTSSRGKVVADAGAKSMTIDQRSSGVLRTDGFGKIKGYPDLLIKKLSDEHAVINASGALEIGDRIEIIPNHVCPTVNLYDRAYGVRRGKVEKVVWISGRGCVQ